MPSPRESTDSKGRRVDGWAKQQVRNDCHRASQGQSTVEFAIVCAALVCIVAGLAALLHLFDQGAVVQHALNAASHHVVSGDAGAWGDVLAY